MSTKTQADDDVSIEEQAAAAVAGPNTIDDELEPAITERETETTEPRTIDDDLEPAITERETETEPSGAEPTESASWEKYKAEPTETDFDDVEAGLEDLDLVRPVVVKSFAEAASITERWTGKDVTIDVHVSGAAAMVYVSRPSEANSPSSKDVDEAAFADSLRAVHARLEQLAELGFVTEE